MGAAYPVDGSGVKSTFTSSFSQTIDLSQFTKLQHRMVGFVDPAFTGTFDTLQFLLIDNGTTLEDKTFTDVTAATAFFADQTLDLGSLVGMTGAVDLGFEFDFTSHQIGDSFVAEMIFGNTTAGSGSAPGSPVPEPGTGYLLGFGLAAFAGLCAVRSASRQ
jgi:hypothetical protein